MREIMEKARNAINARKIAQLSEKHRRPDSQQARPVSPEDWGMSSEDALKASMVSGYK